MAAEPGKLPMSTISDLLTKGRCTEETLELYLRACQVPRTEEAAWLAARQRALTTVFDGLDGLIRVRQSVPRRLGVHSSIDVPGATGDLPAYIERDIDTDVRALIRTAARQGGMILLVGSSSAGKTRSAYEAVQAELPDWWLLSPHDAGHIAQAAAASPARLVMWLDELPQHHMPALTATVHHLIAVGTVLVATLRPERYIAYTTPPPTGQDDPYARERELLALAEVIYVGDHFSPAEQARARRTADAGDARIAAALESADFGLTQVIAAAPQLIRRWNSADPYAAAVLNAAIDAIRLGVRSPLSAELLRAAAPGYCDRRQRAAAPPNWFEAALAYATARINGAAAALAPVAPSAHTDQMGQFHGYTVADYLQQHAGSRRRWSVVPESLWQTLITHVTDPDDRRGIAEQASHRLLYCFAEPLWATLADGGDPRAARLLAVLLRERGDGAGLQARADAGDVHAARLLAELLRERGDAAGLQARADTGEIHAARLLTMVLRERGDADQLQARANDVYAAQHLAELLRERGDAAGLEARADTGDTDAAQHLAELLQERGDAAGLEARADTGDTDAAQHLAELLQERGDADQLQARADTGDTDAAQHLAELLQERGDADQLQARADTGEIHAARLLVKLLRERGDADQLQARANAGEIHAARLLVELLRERGDADQLQARADTGDVYATWHLAELLRERRDAAGLQARADAENVYAGWHLAELLRERGDADQLQARADTGDSHAARLLAELLRERADAAGLQARADTGDTDAARLLAELLRERGDADELQGRADTGDVYAVQHLAKLLRERADAAGLQARADTGDTDAAQHLAELLRERGDADQLLARTVMGDFYAARSLVDALKVSGRAEEAERVRVFGLPVPEHQIRSPFASDSLSRLGSNPAVQGRPQDAPESV